MKTIKAAEIPGKIRALVNQAKKELVLVFPRKSKAKLPDTLLAALQNATHRGIALSFIVEKGVEFHIPDKFTAAVYYADKVHACICLNEKQAVISNLFPEETADPTFFDFGVVTEIIHEVEEIRSAYLSKLPLQISNSMDAGKQDVYAQLKPQDGFAKTPNRFSIFETAFKKAFPLHPFIYHKKSHSVQCNRFPFSWTHFEYSGIIRISLRMGPDADYRTLRNENIRGFNDVFSNHKTSWNYPYDHILISGDTTAHGIKAGDINAEAAYICFLIKELMYFLQPIDNIVLRDSLYKKSNLALY